MVTITPKIAESTFTMIVFGVSETLAMSIISPSEVLASNDNDVEPSE